MAEKLSCVELGFVEEVDNLSQLTSPFFPSKVGGKPAWLALSNLPDPKLLSCKNCTKPMVFLLQVYVPSDEDASQTFHRSVFVFCCRDGACYQPTNSNQCFAVFRCQLAKANEFYDQENIENQDSRFSEFQKKVSGKTWSPLCDVCGCLGDKKCGKCHLRCYCSKEHQVFDWKKHKLECGKAVGPELYEAKSGNVVLFPEYELVTEPEQVLHSEKTNLEDTVEEIKNYEKYMKENASNGMATVDDKEWESFAKESKEMNNAVKDKSYLEFKKCITSEPDQVLRYQRHGRPLWLSSSNVADQSVVPKCSCGADRTFEFQILPQLLNHLKVDMLEASIDWGTLVVYTCSKDCDSEPTYKEEFLWKQDFSEIGLPADILSNMKK